MATDAIVPELSPLGQAALDYAARGIPVFPLKPREKRPLTENGFYDATTDENQIRRWWRKWPLANIGIPTGTASGWIVLDMDVRHGATIEDLETRFGALPDTLHAQTGSGGWHFVFAHPGGVVGGKKLDGSRYELKADGGYIVAAPSVHPDGPCYTWQNQVAPAPMPGWLSRAIAADEMPRPKRDGAVVAPTDAANHWLRWALEKSCAGLGDHYGFLLAQQLLVNDVAEVEATLAEYAQAATLNPKDPFTARDITRWMRSAEKSRMVQSGERARSQSLPLPTPERKKPALRLVSAERDEDGDGGGETPEEIQPATGEHRTDSGNARRLVRRHGHNLRYVAAWNEWLIWDGRRWRKDDTGEIVRRAKETARSIFAEAAATEDETEQKAIVKWAFASESRRSIDAMVKLAQSEPEVAATPQAFDSNPWLFNAPNGTLDLKTGALHAHRREDLITKLARANYNADAQLDTWDRYLQSVTGGNTVLIEFLQRAAGYSLTGDTSEEKLFFAHGPTRSGKSTFVEALKATLGDYASTADFDSFIARQNSGGPRDDIADLAGARMVASIEVDEGKKLAEGLVKMLTGGDTVKARHLYQKGFEFRPAFKLWLVANHEPRVDAADDAMWARILRIKFDQQIPKDKRDPNVKKALRDPALGGPAILAWAVRGCLAWQRDGLAIPDEVEQATDEYREAMDPLKDFIADCCEIDPNAWVSVALLRKTYDEWCKANGERYPMNGRKFNEALERKHCEQKPKRVNSKQTRGWQGINVVAEL